jgi:hypothetical protein
LTAGACAYARPALPVDWQGVALVLQRLAHSPFMWEGSALNSKVWPTICRWAASRASISGIMGRAGAPAGLGFVSPSAAVRFHRQRLFDPAIVGEGLAHVPTRVRD